MTLSRTAVAGIQILKNPDLFSRLVLEVRLYDYQQRPFAAIMESIRRNAGLEFLLIFSRQSGKNEAIAHLITYLMNLYRRRGCNIIYGATGDGLGRGIARLEDRLNNPWNRALWNKAAKPVRRILGRSVVTFISSHPSASARGDTADPLLVIDEMQDQHKSHLETVFTPMRAAHNATAVYLGTVRTSYDALWLKKNELEALQQRDGVQRVFWARPEQVTAVNENYRRFLEGQETKFGRRHPIVSSEYYLQPIDTESGFFPPRRLALLRGAHARKREPDNSAVIALIDVAGQDEAATDPLAQLDNPGRDYTVCTIVKIIETDNGRHYQAIDIFTDQGSRHFEDNPGRPSLAARLLAFLQHWRVLHTVIDSSGVGEGLYDWLRVKLGETAVTGFQFTKYSKAALGSSFLALVETGRFKYWTDDEDFSDSWWFFTQARHCTYEITPGGQFERDLKWFVPESAVIDTPAGTQKVHDDRLISAALTAVAEGEISKGNITMGLAVSQVNPGVDPLDNLKF